MVTFEATKTLQDERLLADTLGYPKSWHVVRVVDSSTGKSTFLDTIYAGPPDANSDTYYNHLAAMDAAMKWTEGESTNYDDNGGQMLPIQAEELGVGDEVEVYYEPDAAYFAAVVKKVVHYKDDVRYTVKYKLDRSTQSNVCIDSIRLIKSKKRKKTKTSLESSGADTSEGTTAKKKKKAETEKSPKKQQKNAAPVSNVLQPDPSSLQLASEMGLPEGWVASVAPKSRFTFRSPDGKKKFYSKKAVYAHLGLNPQGSAKKGRKKKRKSAEKPEEMLIASEALVEEGDPPWRTDGHPYLSKRVRYEFSSGDYASGTVTGWISKDDVDKDGEPGFTSEKTGEPAALFHITFDANSAIASQDLEEFELVEALVDDDIDGDETESDE